MADFPGGENGTGGGAQSKMEAAGVCLQTKEMGRGRGGPRPQAGDLTETATPPGFGKGRSGARAPSSQGKEIL